MVMSIVEKNHRTQHLNAFIQRNFLHTNGWIQCLQLVLFMHSLGIIFKLCICDAGQNQRRQLIVNRYTGNCVFMNSYGLIEALGSITLICIMQVIDSYEQLVLSLIQFKTSMLDIDLGTVQLSIDGIDLGIGSCEVV